MHFLVTGGCGFIGSHMVRKLLMLGHHVTNMDKLTYAGNVANVADIANHPNYRFVNADICHSFRVRSVVNESNFRGLFHFAAESHVDRSIHAPSTFVQTNIVGTSVLLDACFEYWQSKGKCDFRFIHVSTDEVYGSLSDEGAFNEQSSYDPHSPYAASKAASDHLVMSYHHTYGFPVNIAHSSNNYGPSQHREKLIPTVIMSALEGRQIPVYGDGTNIRDWIHVEDHCDALFALIAKGKTGEAYNFGGGNELRNLDLVNKLCSILDKIQPRQDGESYAKQIAHVEDRLGHDYRYAMDSAKSNRELDWQPKRVFDVELVKTVSWFVGQLLHKTSLLESHS